MTRRGPVLKRPLDLVLAFAGLVLSAPISLLAALLILVTGGPPILYRQERWGLRGSRFSIAKFRTMRTTQGPPTQAELGDPRVTAVGRVLRAMGIDELPQLLSVLAGDMSLVGPRALAVGEEISLPSGERVRYEDLPGFLERLEVRPGLTGWSTVYLPKDVSPLEKFEADLRYIREQGLLLDLRLIALSLWISFRGRWETRAKKF